MNETGGIIIYLKMDKPSYNTLLTFNFLILVPCIAEYHLACVFGQTYPDVIEPHAFTWQPENKTRAIQNENETYNSNVFQ